MIVEQMCSMQIFLKDYFEKIFTLSTRRKQTNDFLYYNKMFMEFADSLNKTIFFHPIFHNILCFCCYINIKQNHNIKQKKKGRKQKKTMKALSTTRHMNNIAISRITV
ncbi:hypothetical protein Glove_174g140 [Diversispora epigaea]|uniref:Uncharacterized protein n=1 Tax=Diversispora epigaea TaxID=1348612 RepID=A0A397IRL2_9GLOM|nr:hypothetical protein Glove_174g140 [Diversispora epigaea]